MTHDVKEGDRNQDKEWKRGRRTGGRLIEKRQEEKETERLNRETN